VDNIYKVEIRGKTPNFDVELWLVFAKDESEIRDKLEITDPNVRIFVEQITPDKPFSLGLIEFDGTIIPEKKELITESNYDDNNRCEVCGGQMSWCEGCQMWSRTCCDEYGTCMCS
jgi:hypothetical protein